MNTLQPPTLNKKRNQWLEALSGKDRHTIVHQLAQMSWDSATFRMINEARRLAPADPEGGVQLNGLVHSLIDRGFFASQVTSVRRLMDVYPLEGERGVYSLSGLLKELRLHRQLLTRESIFAAEGLAYDYEPIQQRCLEYVEERRRAGEKASFVPADLWWEKHEQRHAVIDRLTGASPHDRQPGDTIQDAVLGNLLGKAERASKEIIDHATKWVAHAATPESRALVKGNDTGISLNKLWAAHEHLCQVAGFVAIYILGDSCPGFLPIPQYDQLRYMNKPLIASSQVAQLQRVWNEFEEECHRWSQWGLDAYEQEFCSSPETEEGV